MTNLKRGLSRSISRHFTCSCAPNCSRPSGLNHYVNKFWQANYIKRSFSNFYNYVEKTHVARFSSISCLEFKRPVKRYSTSTSQVFKWTWEERKFGSLVLDLEIILNQYSNQKELIPHLVEYVKIWKANGKRGILVKIPVKESWAVAELYAIDFKLHHAKKDYIVMTKWLLDDENNRMPLYAFHTVGVSGLVLNDVKREALVVQDKGKITKWKFPGGFSEPNEDIGETAVREIREETGVESEFKSVLTFRQQHRTWFDQSDLYFICLLSPLSFEITACPEEISKCQWLPLKHLQISDEATPLTRLVASLAIRGLENGFDDISMKPVEMTSWVPPYDKTFKVFHRPLDL